jgi:hypothetical protein
MPIEISEDVLQNDEFSMVTDANGDLVLEHKPTGGQFKFDSANNAWTPVQGLAMGGANISGAGSFESNDADVSGPMVSNSVDTGSINSDSITNSGQVTTQDLTVNGTATGVGGGIALESSDTLNVDTVHFRGQDKSFIDLFSGSSATVLGGSLRGQLRLDWSYTFSDGSQKNLHGGDAHDSVRAEGEDAADDQFRVNMLPPAKDVTRVQVGAKTDGGAHTFAANLLRLD